MLDLFNKKFIAGHTFTTRNGQTMEIIEVLTSRMLVKYNINVNTNGTKGTKTQRAFISKDELLALFIEQSTPIKTLEEISDEQEKANEEINKKDTSAT